MGNKNWVIITHRNFHPSDLSGIRDLLREGEGKEVGKRKLNGISNAKVEYIDAGEEWSLPLENTNIITVGTGKQLFDEHISAEGADRRPTCEAVLVSDTLRLENTPQRQRWLDYMFRNDYRGQRASMDFADFIGALHLMHSNDEVLAIGIKIIDGLLDPRCAEQEMTQGDRDTAADFIEKWLKDKERAVAGPIVRFVKGLRNGNRGDFDFTEILTKLTTVYGKEAQGIAQQLLEAKYHRQKTRYLKAVKLVHDLEITGSVLVSRRDGEFCIIYTKKPVDNEDYNKAARAELKADIIIQQNANGRVLVFTNARAPIRRELHNIVAMLRLKEMKIRGLPLETSFRRLTFGGLIEEVPYWYFQIENNPAGGKILNGSLTATGIEPTAIPFNRILEIVTTALRLGYNFQWRVWLRKIIDPRL